jgi:hypothetical protein
MKSLTHARSLSGVVVLASSLALAAGCAADATEDLDPAGTLSGMEFSDEGPPAGEAAPVEDTSPTSGLSVDEITNMPRFELPFPCGQVWAGQTRSNHSPSLAVDFNRLNDFGDPVVAAASGTVSRVDNEGNVSYGRWIEIDHGGGYRTRYAHLSSQLVRVGQHVDRGDRIGLLGSTGGSTGPHLHYELRRNGVVIRPVFHGATALFWGTRNYTSQNCGATSGGGTTGGTTGVVGRVNTSGLPLTVRSGPGTGYRDVGSVSDGATVRISCQVRGTSVSGTYGTSTLWDHIGTGYVSDAYVSTGSDGQVAPTCR